MTEPTGERADLTEILHHARRFIRHTTSGLTDEQAGSRPVPSSELCLGGLVKHIAAREQGWCDFVERGAGTQRTVSEDANAADATAWANEFRLLPDETLAGVLADFERAAKRTDSLVASVDLDHRETLPEAPWFPPGAQWSLRQVFLHLASEISQHAGHADILREAIDGQKSMG